MEYQEPADHEEGSSEGDNDQEEYEHDGINEYQDGQIEEYADAGGQHPYQHHQMIDGNGEEYEEDAGEELSQSDFLGSNQDEDDPENMHYSDENNEALQHLKNNINE